MVRGLVKDACSCWPGSGEFWLLWVSPKSLSRCNFRSGEIVSKGSSCMAGLAEGLGFRVSGFCSLPRSWPRV